MIFFADDCYLLLSRNITNPKVGEVLYLEAMSIFKLHQGADSIYRFHLSVLWIPISCKSHTMEEFLLSFRVACVGLHMILM